MTKLNMAPESPKPETQPNVETTKDTKAPAGGTDAKPAPANTTGK